MKQSKSKIVFECASCGHIAPRWEGRCPSCSSWGTLEEKYNVTKAKSSSKLSKGSSAALVGVLELEQTSEGRFSTGLSELDLVLGGGIVPGSLVLLGGEPGIGKSTLLTQVLLQTDTRKGLKRVYVTGEETSNQVATRLQRISSKDENAKDCFIIQSNNIDEVLALLQTEKVGILMIDSLQTISSEDGMYSPGGAAQVRDVALKISEFAKSRNVATFIVGHVTKDGIIAGPKYIEHMVDVVMYFEADVTDSLRAVRCTKNRYGEVGQVACFAMTQAGLETIPSLNERLLEIYGGERNAVYSVLMDGRKPVVVEIEALVSKANAGLPRRLASGIMVDRLYMLIGIIEKYLKVRLSSYDVFVNVTSGFKVKDNSVDLAVCNAIVDSYRRVENRQKNLMMIGEVGLSGNVKTVPRMTERINEARRLGFDRIVVGGKAKYKNVTNIASIIGLK